MSNIKKVLAVLLGTLFILTPIINAKAETKAKLFLDGTEAIKASKLETSLGDRDKKVSNNKLLYPYKCIKKSEQLSEGERKFIEHHFIHLLDVQSPTGEEYLCPASSFSYKKYFNPEAIKNVDEILSKWIADINKMYPNSSKQRKILNDVLFIKSNKKYDTKAFKDLDSWIRSGQNGDIKESILVASTLYSLSISNKALCGGAGQVLTRMLQLQDIPAYTAYSYLHGVYHAVTVAYVDNKWRIYDGTPSAKSYLQGTWGEYQKPPSNIKEEPYKAIWNEEEFDKYEGNKTQVVLRDKTLEKWLEDLSKQVEK